METPHSQCKSVNTPLSVTFEDDKEIIVETPDQDNGKENGKDVPVDKNVADDLTERKDSFRMPQDDSEEDDDFDVMSFDVHV